MDTVYRSSGAEAVKVTVGLGQVNYCRHLKVGGDVGERRGSWSRLRRHGVGRGTGPWMCIQSSFRGGQWPAVRGERAPWEAESKPGNVKWGQTLEGQECWAESHGHNQCCCCWIWQHHWVSRKCTARAPELPNIDYQTWANILGSSISKSSSHWECDLNHFLPWISY